MAITESINDLQCAKIHKADKTAAEHRCVSCAILTYLEWADYVRVDITHMLNYIWIHTN